MKRMGLLLLGLPLVMGQTCGITTDPELSPDPPGSSPDPPPSTPAPKTVTGPGFSLELPGDFDLSDEAEPPMRTNFAETYANGERLIAISTETPMAQGPYRFHASGVRIRDAQVSDSGDWLLVVSILQWHSGAENLAAYCALANGDLLRVEICTGRALTDEDQDFATTLFRSIVLDDTDGRTLESRIRTASGKLLGHTEQGLMVLDDLTAWIVADEAPATALSELRSWGAGYAIHIQTAAEVNEAMAVGRWIHVPVRSLGIAVRTQIASFDPATRRLSFTNGQSKVLRFAKLPSAWAVGDEVFIVHDQMCDWLIRTRSWHWMRF